MRRRQPRTSPRRKALRCRLWSISCAPDVTFCNMETLILEARSSKGCPQAECGCYNVSLPEVASVSKTMGFNLVGRANNHALDWDVEGMRETSRALDIAGIVHAGPARIRRRPLRGSCHPRPPADALRASARASRSTTTSGSFDYSTSGTSPADPMRSEKNCAGRYRRRLELRVNGHPAQNCGRVYRKVAGIQYGRSYHGQAKVTWFRYSRSSRIPRPRWMFILRLA